MELTVENRKVFAYTGAREFDRAQPTTVFLHGAGSDHSVWILQSRYFANHGHNVLALDLPGHGRSQGEPLASIEELAGWTARVLDAANIDEVAIVGHSMGSLIALETSARHPARVRALALLGISVPMMVSDALLDAARDDESTACDIITGWGHSDAAQIGGNQTPGMWMAGGTRRLLQRSRQGALYTDLKACADYAEGLQRAVEVQAPTLLLLGKRDRMTPPRAAGDLAAAIAGSRTVLIDHCGHHMMAERPDQVLDALVASIG